MTSVPNSPAIKTRRDLPTPMPSAAEFIRAHYRFQEGRFFTAIKINGETAHSASDVAVPMWNHSTWFGENDSTFETFLQETEQWHSEHNRRPVVYLIAQNETILTHG